MSPWSKHVPQLASSARYPQDEIIRDLLPLLPLHPPLPAKRAPAATPGAQLRLVDWGRRRVEGPRLVELQVVLVPGPPFAPVPSMRPGACIWKGHGVN